MEEIRMICQRGHGLNLKNYNNVTVIVVVVKSMGKFYNRSSGIDICKQGWHIITVMSLIFISIVGVSKKQVNQLK